jgi:hypothetical protein
VMYLCRKMMTMYCCEDYMDFCCDLYALNLNCHFFCCLFVPYFGDSPSEEAAKSRVIWTRGRGARGRGVPIIFVGYM